MVLAFSELRPESNENSNYALAWKIGDKALKDKNYAPEAIATLKKMNTEMSAIAIKYIAYQHTEHVPEAIAALHEMLVVADDSRIADLEKDLENIVRGLFYKVSEETRTPPAEPRIIIHPVRHNPPAP